MENIIKLSELSVGEKAEITVVGSMGDIKRRLLEMGVVKGAKLEVERVAPLGDPIEIYIKGYHLSLRRTEADEIEITRL
jgi:ferrous iron transport protein A